MDRVWLLNASSTPPAQPPSLEIGYPVDSGPATIPGAWWHHSITEELRNCITTAGLVPASGNLTQLAQAVAVIAKQSVSSGTTYPVRAVDNVGVTLNGIQNVDGVALVAGDRVLRVVGNSATNGIYVVNATGAWTRPNDMLAGVVLNDGVLTDCSEGTTFADTLWTLNLTGVKVATIGTTAISFTNITDTLNGKFATYLLTATAAVTYAPQANPSFTGNLTLSSYTVNSVPYVNSSKVLTSGNNLTFDGNSLSVSGSVTSGSFNPTASAIPVNGLYLSGVNTLGFSTAGSKRITVNASGYLAIGALDANYQLQVSGAGQSMSAWVDGASTQGMAAILDTSSALGNGGALLLGTTLTAGKPIASIKAVNTNTSTGSVGDLAFGLRLNAAATSLTEYARLTSAGNFLVGTPTDITSATSGNIVANAYVYGNQVVGSVAGSGGQLQAVGGSNTTWYSAMLRNDGTTAGLRSTSAVSTMVAASNAAFNAFRPLEWNLTTGAVSIDSNAAGVSFGGAVTAPSPAVNDNSSRIATTSWVATKVAGLTPGGGGTGSGFTITVPPFMTVSPTGSQTSGTFALGLSGTPVPVLNGGTGGTTGFAALGNLGGLGKSDWTKQTLNGQANQTYTNTLSITTNCTGRLVLFSCVNSTFFTPGYNIVMGLDVTGYASRNVGDYVLGSFTEMFSMQVGIGQSYTMTQTAYMPTVSIGGFSMTLMYVLFPASS